MKAKITDVKFNKEYDTRYGKRFSFKIYYNKKVGYYSSTDKDQTKFIKGQEAEFTEETRWTEYGEMLIVKPIRGQANSNFGKAIKREQSRYSGFAMSYAKDMAVAQIISIDELFKFADDMFTWMVEKDKTLQS